MTDADHTLYNCAKDGCDKGPFKKETYRRHWKRHHSGDWPLTMGQGHRTDLAPGIWQNIITSWKQLPDAHPHKTSGLAALISLRDTPFSDCLGTNVLDIFHSPPKVAHILEDLEYALYSPNHIPGELYYTSSGLEAPDLKPSHLHASVTAMTALDLDFIELEHLCYSAGVQSHDPAGLEACGPQVPSSASHLGIPSTGGLPQMETAYTPRGHITKIHVDGFWDGAILTCLFGTKLLLHWPPTPHNLQVLGTEWPVASTADLNIIPQLQDIKIYHMSHGHHVYLPPGSLHAVFALQTSAMATFGIKHPEMIASGLKLSEWLCNHLDSLPLDFPNRSSIERQAREGAATHCDVSHDLYSGSNLLAHHALYWVSERF